MGLGIVFSGVLWFAVYNVALNAAERELDAGTAAMLISIGPVVIALLAGCAVALAGAVVIGAATSEGVVDASGSRAKDSSWGRLASRPKVYSPKVAGRNRLR